MAQAQESRAAVVVRWSAQIITLVVVCPSIATGLIASFIPALQFGSAIEYPASGDGIAAAVLPGCLYAGSSLLIIGVPMIASACRVGRRFFLLPDWSLAPMLLVAVGMFLLFAALFFPGFEAFASPRATLGHSVKLSLTAYTALILAVGMVLVADRPPPPDRRSRRQTMCLVFVPLVPAATAAVILGAACLLFGH